jgi:hypothetical protein
MGTIHRVALQVFADYHQFYVQDGGVNPDAPTELTTESCWTFLRQVGHQ